MHLTHILPLVAAAAATGPIVPLLPQLCPLLPVEPTLPGGQFEGPLSPDGDRVALTVAAGAGVDIELLERDGPAWRSLGPLGLGGTLPAQAGFGHDLDLEGGSLLVAMPQAVQIGGQRGVIRPFDETPSGWLAGTTLTTGHPRAQNFGDSFDRDGDVLVAHSWWTDLATVENRLHLFERNGAGEYVETGSIDDPTPAPAGEYGYLGEALAVDGEWIVAGGHATVRGRAHVWRRTSAGVLHQQELVPHTPVTGAYGSAVAVDGEFIAVADPDAPIAAPFFGSGVVHVFRYDTGANAFLPVHAFRAPAGLTNVVGFGESIALDGLRLAATFRTVNFVNFPSREGLAVFAGIGSPNVTTQHVLQAPGTALTAIGRRVAFARGELLATARTLIAGNAVLPLDDLGRFAVGTPGVRTCAGGLHSGGSVATLLPLTCPTSLWMSCRASQLPPNTAFVPLLGTDAAMLPVGQGTLCVAGPRRLQPGVSGAAGTADVTFSPAVYGHARGDVVRVQVWYRDGGATNLSEAWAFELAD